MLCKESNYNTNTVIYLKCLPLEEEKKKGKVGRKRQDAEEPRFSGRK